MFASLRTSLGRVGRRIRFVAASVCLLLAGVSALESSRAAPAPTSHGQTKHVVVTVGELPAGHLLRSRDLTVARLPSAAVPTAAARDPAAVIGRRLAGPMTAREVIAPPRLLGTGLTTGLDAAMVAAPVSIDADLGGLVRAGDRVDLVGTPDPDRSGTVPSRPRHDDVADAIVERARVLAVLAPSESEPGTHLVLAVSRRDALRIADAGVSERFAVVADAP